MKISQNVIDEHRAIYPLPFHDLKYYSSFAQIIGSTPDAYSAVDRRQRWDKNMQLLIDAGHPDAVEYWKDQTACINCVWLEKETSWCINMELPNTVNPILTIGSGVMGMACMGFSYETGIQLEFDI